MFVVDQPTNIHAIAVADATSATGTNAMLRLRSDKRGQTIRKIARKSVSRQSQPTAHTSVRNTRTPSRYRT